MTHTKRTMDLIAASIDRARVNLGPDYPVIQHVDRVADGALTIIYTDGVVHKIAIVETTPPAKAG